MGRGGEEWVGGEEERVVGSGRGGSVEEEVVLFAPAAVVPS